MPTYAYRCSACEHEFDAVQSFHDDPLTLCPNCGTAAAKRVFRSVGVIFKGSGWYINDLRKDRGRGGKAAETANGGEVEAPAAAKDEGSSGSDDASGSGGDSASTSDKDSGGGATSESGTPEGAGKAKGSAPDVDAKAPSQGPKKAPATSTG